MADASSRRPGCGAPGAGRVTGAGRPQASSSPIAARIVAWNGAKNRV
ncbi:hypothetical protein GLA29479_1562 [Lysobacter antibioticus]|nr:hypothetical protein GLA29479_1562 [Lysobacter antibioticus]